MPEDLNTIGHHPDPPTGDFPRKVLFTSGAPTGTGWEGRVAIDEDAGDIYRFESGAWVLKSSGGGSGSGTGDVTYHEGAFLDPNGNVTGNEGHMYISLETLGGDGRVWWKAIGTGNNNTGWE